MRKYALRMTREARSHAHNPETVRKAALDAIKDAQTGEVYFLPFKAEGKQFALSARTIIEIGWFPHRIPGIAKQISWEPQFPKKKR